MSTNIIASEKYGSNADEYHYVTTTDGDVQVTTSNKEKHQKIGGGLKHFFKSAFLPQGYPESVSNDYLEYQCWDTLQAFCSSITGTLATQAVLKGYGVGDKTATVAGATITWMLKDGMGMIGRILFAWFKGTQLDCDAKRWRLFADVLNDFAILLDLIAPLFKSFFIFIVCLSSVARSIVGVSGGATRAALTLHQAQRDNMADVSAKDGSQETLVNLMALLAGFVITPLVSNNQLLVWTLFFLFTFLHLFANYRAVCCVVMDTLNLPRMYLAIMHYLKYNDTLNPTEMSKLDPVLRRPGYSCSIVPGARLSSVLRSAADINFLDSSSPTPMYLIGFDEHTIHVVLHNNAADYDIMRGCFSALLLDILHHNPSLQAKNDDIQKQIDSFNVKDEVSHSLIERITEHVYPDFEKCLLSKGWDLKTCHLGIEEWRAQWNKKTN